MYLNSIFENINKHINLDETEIDHLTGLIQEVSVPKGQYIQKQGEPCNYIYFVNSGLLRAFFLSPKGKDTTIMFAKADWWITDMHCFLNQLPAMVSIQSIEPSQVLRLSKKSLDDSFERIPQFNTYFRILIQNAYCREQLRTIQNLSLTAKERYEQFTTKYPEISSQITLKQTASYLGITPEFLSAIRAEKD